MSRAGSNPAPGKMKIIYFLKNIKNIPQFIQKFIQKKVIKLEKLVSKEGGGLLEVEIGKTREIKEKKGMVYKVKLFFDTPKRSSLIVLGWGKNIYQAFNTAFKKLINLIKKKKEKK